MRYLLIPWSKFLLEKLTRFQPVKKFPAYYGSRRFIIAFKNTHHLSLSWASSIPSISSHPTSWRSILILSSHLRLGLPSGPFPSCFPTKTLNMPLLFPIRATWTAHHFILYFITRTALDEECRSLSSSLCSFIHCPGTSCLLGPNILLCTLFSNTLNLRSFLTISDQVLHPYKTTGRIIVLYILILKFLDIKLEERKILHRMIASIPWLQSALNFFLNRFWFVKVVSKYLNSSTHSKHLLSSFILWLRPAFWFRDMTMYLVLSQFTSISISFSRLRDNVEKYYIVG